MENPENSPGFVFVSLFSACPCGVLCVWIMGFFSSPPSIFFPDFSLLFGSRAKRVVDIFTNGSEVELRQIQGLGEVKDNLGGAENTGWALGQCGAKILHRVRYLMEQN